MNKNPKLITEIEQEVFEDFQIYDSWAEKYEYLIELGRLLPKLDPDQKIEKNKLANCTSRVWIITDINSEGGLIIQAESDSLIIAGLIYLIIKLYNLQKPKEILDTKLEIFKRLGFEKHLSANRANGLELILTKINSVCLDCIYKTNLSRA